MNDNHEREWVESAAREHARRAHAEKVFTPPPPRQSRYTTDKPYKPRALFGTPWQDWAVLIVIVLAVAAGIHCLGTSCQ